MPRLVFVKPFPGMATEADLAEAGGGGAPSGPASGDLGGTYPAPTVTALHTTTGPTKLTLGAVADGEFLKRDGTTVVGAAAGGASNLIVAGPYSFDFEDALESGFGIGAVGDLPAGCIPFQVFVNLTTAFAPVGGNAAIQLYAGLAAGQWGKLVTTFTVASASSENDEAITGAQMAAGAEIGIRLVQVKVDSQLVLYANYDGLVPLAGAGSLYVLAVRT